jgi:hypothetical protein
LRQDNGKIGYWYKGYVTLKSGLPSCLEGGITAYSAYDALQTVRSMTDMWSVQKVVSLYIYRLDDDGNINPKPATFMKSGPYNEQGVQPKYTGEVASQSILNEPWTRAPVKDVIKTYDEAAWTESFDHASTFTTVKLKENDKCQ